MTKISLWFYMLTLVCVNHARSQDFLGISTSNYAGVTGVMLQPASIVDSRLKFDINLFATTNNYNNNYLLLDRNAILKFNSKNFSDYQTFKSNYLSEANLGTNERVWADVNSRIQMPLSFMATTGKKSAIALNIQSRSMVQERNLPQPFAQLAYNAFYYPPLNNAPVDASGFELNTLSWIDVGFTYGRVLLSNNKHFLKGAFTAKYLGGVASLHMSSNDFRLSVNNDSSINFSTTNYQYRRNEKADFDIFNRGLQPDANAFGFNAGLVYEFRGNVDRFKYISRDDEKSYEVERRDVNKYMIRLGVSIVDAGLFKFNKAATVNNFSGNVTNWQLNQANFDNISQFDTALNNRTTALANNPQTYNVHLPTALSVQLDIRFLKGLYLNAVAYRPLKLNTNDDGYRFNNYGYYAITPRWEGRHFGIYIPYTFMNHKNIADYKQNYLGATIRLGPVFFGSSNLGTMAFNKNLKAAELHAGIKIGITYGKPNKASMLLEKFTKNKSGRNYSTNTTTADSSLLIANRRLDSASGKSLPLLIDYNTGKIYSDPNRTGNIIIINNNAYYPAQPGKDSIIRERIILQQAKDTSYILVDSTAKNVWMNAKNDSAKKVLTDSLNHKKVQLDSTIKSLEKLRREMDKSQLNKTNADTNTARIYFPAKDTARRVITSTDTVLIAGNRTKILQPNNNLVSDSMSLTSNGNTFKKKVRDESAKQVSRQKTIDQQQMANENFANEQLLNNNEAVTRNLERQNQLMRQQNDYYKREIDNANRLQSEIKDLQRQRDRYNRRGGNIGNYGYNNQPYEQRYVPIPVPAYNRQAASAAVRDTLVVKDTVYIRDTTVTHTTLHDTVWQAAAQPATVYVPVEKETVIKQQIDYTLLPEEVVLFEPGKSSVRPVYHGRLNYLANMLNKDSSLLATITGHTDKTGSAAINEALSKKRAAAVSNYFLSNGVQAKQLTTEALSASDPAATGNTKTAYSQNRRVTIKLTKR